MTAEQSAGELDAFYRVPDPWGYDENPDDARRRSELLGALPRQPYGRVLDIGCGNGFVTLSLPGTSVIGLDVSQEAIRWAQRAAAEAHDAARFEFRCMSIFDSALQQLGEFDLIVITGVLYPQYVGRAMSVARANIDRVLVPGGVLATCHIREWALARMPYSLMDITIYPYRGRTHQLEIFRK